MLVGRFARKEEKPMDSKLYKYLLSEYNSHFSGWDFSHISGRMQEDVLPWNYKEIINRNLNRRKTLLDLDTGGGEFLDSIENLPKRTFATEGYEPNIGIAKKKLEKRGIVVKPVTNNGHLPFEDNYFELITNRHGSYQVDEIKRILSDKGIFITQQVGSLNAIDLNTSLGITSSKISTWCLVSNIENFRNAKMKILESNENIGKYRFYDIGAIVYYLKCIPWQVPEFSIEKYINKIEIMNDVIIEKGYIDFISHRFYLIVSK